MGDRYWVGGTANWDGTAGTKWALTSGGAGGQAVPTSSDDVYFDAISNAYTITLTNYQSCRSLNFKDGTGGAFTGTFTTGGYALSIYGNLKMSSGMTATGYGEWKFLAASGDWTFTTDGVSFARRGPTFGMTGTATVTVVGDLIYSEAYGPTFTHTGTVTFQGKVTCPSGIITQTSGTVNFGNGDISASQIQNTGTTARTMTLGSNVVAVTALFYFTGSNLTFNCGTSSITVTVDSTIFKGLSQTFYDVTFIGNTANFEIEGSNTFHILNINPTTTKKLIILSGITQTITSEAQYKGATWVPFALPSGISVTSPASSDYVPALSTTEITLSCTTGVACDNVYVQINDKVLALVNTGGNNWSKAIYAGYFGECTGATIYFTCRKDSGDLGTAASASTITIPAITAETDTLLSEIVASFATAGITAVASLVGEEEIGSTIRSLIKISVATYDVATIDAIRNRVSADVSSWSGTVTSVEYAAPISTTHSVVIFKMLHS